MTTMTDRPDTSTPNLEPNNLESTHQIQNPILRGFNPDPSILRVGDDYYIATSTFEWFPGVQIHHSRDLVNWRVLSQPLSRVSQLDMRGNGDSGGIWAPCLSYSEGLFYLIYTDVKAFSMIAGFKDTHNFVVTSPSIEGPWSEPAHLNSSGFDPSLFHDSIELGGDGKKWFLNMVWDHRKGKNQFGGILLQEFDSISRTLVGPIKNIFHGTKLRVTEGSHIYKRDGWYYLLVAEGGTSYEHAVTLARSRKIDGPYEVHPQNPILTAWEKPELELQKTGHASWVETQNGEWYMAHLCGRPLEPIGNRGYCNLGRETALQKLEWGSDGWPRLAGGGNAPSSNVPAPKLSAHPWPLEPARDGFDSSTLGIHWQTLREPADSSWLSLTERSSHLRLRGRESPISVHHQSLVGRRLQAFHAEATTKLEFEPEHFQQMAGIAAYYDSKHWVYLRVSRDETLGKTLNILVTDAGAYSEPLEQDVQIPESGPIYLRVNFAKHTFQFSYSSDGVNWLEIGPAFESYKLSDDYCNGLAFTGTFIALCVQDLAGTKKHADFDFFEYHELD
jgi:xylan 1,4-beta-xylosidase